MHALRSTKPRSWGVYGGAGTAATGGATARRPAGSRGTDVVGKYATALGTLTNAGGQDLRQALMAAALPSAPRRLPQPLHILSSSGPFPLRPSALPQQMDHSRPSLAYQRGGAAGLHAGARVHRFGRRARLRRARRSASHRPAVRCGCLHAYEGAPAIGARRVRRRPGRARPRHDGAHPQATLTPPTWRSSTSALRGQGILLQGSSQWRSMMMWGGICSCCLLPGTKAHQGHRKVHKLVKNPLTTPPNSSYVEVNSVELEPDSPDCIHAGFAARLWPLLPCRSRSQLGRYGLDTPEPDEEVVGCDLELSPTMTSKSTRR